MRQDIGAAAAPAARLRVLHVFWDTGIGGICRLILDLVAEQKRDPGLEVAAMALSAQGGGFDEAFRRSGVPILNGGMRGGMDLSPRAFLRLVRTLRRYDVIHVHAFNPLLALATRVARARVVVTMHGPLAHGREPRLSDRVNAALMGAWLRHVDLVTYNSRFTETLCRRLYGLERVRSVMVHNGAVLTPQAPSALDPDTARRVTGQFVVGTTARFAQFKRIDRLIEGFQRFAAGRPALLLLVGDGPLRGELEAQAARLGVADKVWFAGYQQDVTPYQQAMSVFVCSSAAEPFGLVTVEALNLGRPVIVFADGGGGVEVVGDLCRDDVVDDVDGLAARLAHYFGHRDGEDAARARREYARRFDIRVTARAFRDLYTGLFPCAA